MVLLIYVLVLYSTLINSRILAKNVYSYAVCAKNKLKSLSIKPETVPLRTTMLNTRSGPETPRPPHALQPGMTADNAAMFRCTRHLPWQMFTDNAILAGQQGCHIDSFIAKCHNFTILKTVKLWKMKYLYRLFGLDLFRDLCLCVAFFSSSYSSNW